VWEVREGQRQVWREQWAMAVGDGREIESGESDEIVVVGQESG
jgi:hypothetical protein